MKKARFLLVLLILLASVMPASAAPKQPLAKNVIVMISDGWGYNHLEAVSYYEYGKDARQIYNRFPFQWAMSTYSYYCSYDPGLAWSDSSTRCPAGPTRPPQQRRWRAASRRMTQASAST